jgi:malonate transporter
MQAVVNAALPIFALILTGYVCGKRGLLNRAATESLNLFAVYLALPALLFHVLTRITLEQFSQAGFAAAFAGGIALTFAVAFGLGQRGNRRLAEAGMEGLNASYGNVGFMGIPLCLLVFGESGIAPAVISTLFVGCMLFAFAIVLIEADLNRHGGAWRTARMVAVSIARNPLVIAPAFGILIGTTGVSLPAPVERFVVLLGGAASPCALVCIGLFLAQERVGGAMRTVSLLVGLKLVLQPAVTALLAYHAFSMPEVWARGRAPQRSADRVRSLHDRKALRPGRQHNLGGHSRVPPCFAHHCVVAGGVAGITLIERLSPRPG